MKKIKIFILCMLVMHMPVVLYAQLKLQEDVSCLIKKKHLLPVEFDNGSQNSDISVHRHDKLVSEGFLPNQDKMPMIIPLATIRSNTEGKLSKETGTVSDVNGNQYNTVLVDDRWWMAENLKTSSYRNGDPIQSGIGVENISDQEDPKYFFYYNNNPNFESTYGKLYTWYVVNDPRKVCPDGWYIPTLEDWENLRDFLDPDASGSDNIAGGKMKTTGTIEDGTGLWFEPNTGASNSSGFASQPAGFYNTTSFVDQIFYMMGESVRYLSSTETSNNFVWGASNSSYESSLWIYSNHDKKWGGTVRCIQNPTETITLPTISTLDAQDVTTYSARISAVITENGGISVSNRGFYFGTSEEFSEDDKIYMDSGSGVFELTVSDLRPSTTYFYKSFATNEAGESFGDVKSFTTNTVTQGIAMEIATEGFNTYWQAIKSYNIGMTADVMADHSTCSWGNFAWQDQSNEPRAPWDNEPDYGYAYMTLDLWDGLYSLMINVNDVIDAIENNGLQIGTEGQDTPMVLTAMYFIRGASLGQLGLTFDQAWIANTIDLPITNPLSPWNEVIEAAIDDLNEAIVLSNANIFELPWGTVPGIAMSNDYMAQLANSYAARFLALGSRTNAQNEDLNWTASYSWTDVLQFTNNGITTDFAPIGDGLPWNGGSWYDLNIKYLRQDGWGRVDMRVINLLDPNQPVRFPTDNVGLPILDVLPNNGLATSTDARLETDFQYLASHSFRPERGGWHFSHYRHSRYDNPPTTSSEGYGMGESVGPLFELRVYDNEIMKAEAMVRANSNYTGAADILNDAGNPRKARGGLDDVPATEEDLLDAIFYERDIELFHNGYLISYCDMRRRDMLQKGTPLHLPVPGAILTQLGEAIYTYGGIQNADGINTSNGGNWIEDQYNFALLTVENDGNGHTIPESGEYYKNLGIVEINAYPNQGFVFSKWIINGNEEVESNPLILDFNDETHVIATFAETTETQFELSLTVDGVGGIQPNQGVYYLSENETISLDAFVEDNDWFFVNWTNNEGQEVSSEESFTYTMPASDIELTANFDVYKFNLSLNVEGAGTTSPAEGTHEYPIGTKVDIFASPSAGYVFEKWVVNGDEFYIQNLQVTLNEDITATAYFVETEENQFTLSVSIDGEGTVSPPEGNHVYVENDVVTLTATPSSGWDFEKWIINGAEVTINPTNVTVTNDVEVTAYFTIVDNVNLENLSQVKLYPNPFTSVLKISNAQQVSLVEITNILGQVVIKKSLTGSDVEVLSTQKLNKGIYLVRIYGLEGEHSVTRVVKE